MWNAEAGNHTNGGICHYATYDCDRWKDLDWLFVEKCTHKQREREASDLLSINNWAGWICGTNYFAGFDQQITWNWAFRFCQSISRCAAQCHSSHVFVCGFFQSQHSLRSQCNEFFSGVCGACLPFILAIFQTLSNINRAILMPNNVLIPFRLPKLFYFAGSFGIFNVWAIIWQIWVIIFGINSNWR